MPSLEQLDLRQPLARLLAQLERAPAPPQPRLAVQASEPRRVNTLSLIDGKTFAATTLAGDIAPAGASDIGFFHRDTRFLSHLELRINEHRGVVLSSNTQQTLYSQIELTPGGSTLRDGLDLTDNTVHIRREQLMANCCLYDHLLVRTFHHAPVEMELEYLYGADFADVFQVRGMLRNQSGTYYEPLTDHDSIRFIYVGRDNVLRQTLLRFDPAPVKIDGQSARFRLCLEPRQRQSILLSVHATAEPLARIDKLGDNGQARSYGFAAFADSLRQRRDSFAQWQREATQFESSNEVFNSCLNTAAADFFSLRIPYDSGGEIIAAGIPWFATIFGRDSLIAAYQSLMLRPHLAQETLSFLARYQGKCQDDMRDEQPGKILHELREGEMTGAGEMPHSPYYGSVDSTPLFLIVLSETYQWTGDTAWLETLMPAARAALRWIERDGDLDGDGLVEYQRRAPRGLSNQGWKDSWDANLHRDGSLVQSPVALCEVQGYCYDARYRMSRLLRALGDTAEADRLRREAADLAKRFERAFWMPNQAFYAMSLDRDKRQQEVVASNAGHLLWSRILGRDHARQVARRLLQDDMFSGWGVRTLSADEPIYNPLSYHRGSVWPHDNSLIAQGLAFYDFKAAVDRILTAQFQAATHFRDLRLPELFVGVQRRDFDEPVHYPVSCSPQAWASGAFFLLLNAALGIRPNAGKHELRIVNPVLPEWLHWLRIRHMRIGQSQVSLEFSRHGHRTFCNVLDVQGERLAISVDFTPRLES